MRRQEAGRYTGWAAHRYRTAWVCFFTSKQEEVIMEGSEGNFLVMVAGKKQHFLRQSVQVRKYRKESLSHLLKSWQ
jgi:hypothetical protein